VHRKLTGTNLVLAAAALFCLLVVTIALAGSAAGAGDPKATTSAVTTAKFKKLKKQVAALQQQVDALARLPGPQGPQGPPGAPGTPGSAAACAGNDANDVMVEAGAVCIDRYEASVWSSPTGGTQYGMTSDNYPCDDDGQDCTNIYARSVAGATPSRFITWFQAQQALANTGKRLATSAEWQQAVAGTPDPGASPGAEGCNTDAGAAVATGSRDNCVSRFGANDMIGNITEWVADWDEQGDDSCATWPAGFGTDESCVGRAMDNASTGFPAALLRGGSAFTTATDPGAFNVYGGATPSQNLGTDVGFRGAR
jgi:formylglycine-generating enzyme required for sulfatase activity